MLFLVQDGITNGAIYALLGLALVLVFAVTRVILIPQGEFVTYGALTYASLAAGQMPGTAKLALALGIGAFVFDLFVARKALHGRLIVRSLVTNVVLPAIVLALTIYFAAQKPPVAVCIALSLVIVAMIGLYLYRIAFQPLAHTSVLVLLIASVGVHLALQGLGLLFFGAEGQRGPAVLSGAFTAGALRFTGQSITVYGITIAFIVGLWLFFGLTLYGKALRATAVNRLGARLAGIRTTLSGQIAFLLASVIGALSGIMIVPITTLYYDSGLPDRPEGLRRRDHRRPRQLSAHRRRGAGRRHRRGVLVLLRLQLQGSDRLHAADPRAAAALARRARGRGREGLTRRCRAGFPSSSSRSSWRRSRSSRACRRSGSCCSTISALPPWSRWASCCSPASAA